MSENQHARHCAVTDLLKDELTGDLPYGAACSDYCDTSTFRCGATENAGAENSAVSTVRNAAWEENAGVENVAPEMHALFIAYVHQELNSL